MLSKTRTNGDILKTTWKNFDSATSWWTLNHEQKSPVSSEPCNDTNCRSYSPLLYFYSEIWASVREHWNMKQKWDWHSGKQGMKHGVHCKKQRPRMRVEKVSAHPTQLLTGVAPTPAPEHQTFPLKVSASQCDLPGFLVQMATKGHVTQMYIFFFHFSSTKLNVNFIPYFVFQTPQHRACYFLYEWARFPLNRVFKLPWICDRGMWISVKTFSGIGFIFCAQLPTLPFLTLESKFVN